MFSRFPWQRDLPSWYPPFSEYNSLLLTLRRLGLYRDEHLDFKEKMDAQRKARGKGPPKKGHVTDIVCAPVSARPTLRVLYWLSTKINATSVMC